MVNLLSGWVRLEALSPLVFSDEGDDGRDLIFAEARHRCHRPEPPMVLRGTESNGLLESEVSVMVRLVYEGQVRRTFFSTSKIIAVAFGAVGRIERFAHSYQSRVLFWNLWPVDPRWSARDQEQERCGGHPLLSR